MLNKPRKIDRKMRETRDRFLVATPRPGLLEWLAVPVTAISRWIDVLLMEKRRWTPMSWKNRLRAWRHGICSFHYDLYGLENKSPDDYIPDVAHLRFGYDLNGRYTEALFSKIAFAHIMQSLGARQPPVLGVLFGGYFYPDKGTPCGILPGIRGLLEDGKKLVLRPSFGGGGTGIFFLEQTSGGYLLNSLPVEQDTFETLLRPLHDYLVTEYVIQAAYAAEIAPESTNTLRLLTLWDVDKNSPFIAASCHRFGRVGLGPLDNFHSGAGGLSAPIDVASGELGMAIGKEDGKIQKMSHHPDTGKPIAGIFVPDWEQTIEELLAVAARLPYAPCVGWDLVKLEQGWTCLEGNPFPGYAVWQVHSPILSDPRARKFYRDFGMLK